MHRMQPTTEELNDAQRLIQQALAEDLREAGDITSQALIPAEEQGSVRIVSRQQGVLAGLPFAELVYAALGDTVQFERHVEDGSRLHPGTAVATITGSVRALLTGERTALNLLTLLSGNASLTAQFVDAVAGTNAKILDTRKTLPGLRLLQKYAIRCGGGANHRIGLFDAVLIKDNHLGAWKAARHGTLADAVRHCRAQVSAGIIVEIEVDTLDQFRDAIQGAPDIVLLDNMTCEQLSQAVELRAELGPKVELEASGGVHLQTVAGIAATGVDRISIGALTHSAPALDLGFDWGRS
ncbi:MAG: carboxylating nicotinate-nucleotide diphosphorylase [Planctomycetaceae bacterium]|nr:carboxylating nicotinate-nucleotide diphosphorylase [Planctomycetaceae bacterium]